MTVRYINIAEKRKTRKAQVFKTPYPMRLPMRSETRERPGEEVAYKKAMEGKKTDVESEKRR